MITVEIARSLIQENCPPDKTELTALERAGGFVLAQDIYAPVDTPPFHQSAMDGYAFSFVEWDGKSALQVVGEVQAGNYWQQKIQANQALRVFTGSALPPGADTVVIQEMTSRIENNLHINDEKIVKGKNVRLQGAQSKKGNRVLEQKQLLTPAAISLLAGMGVAQVPVYPNPTIAIIITGKELMKAEEAPAEGKIYESNSYGLVAALAQMQISPQSVEVVDDEETLIINAIKKQLETDILMLTGGVSVGDYDFVAAALGKCGVEKIFHKVKQKPGKPFYFGKLNHTLVFGLPGNPASVLTCFYEYVADAISRFTHNEYFRKTTLPVANEYHKKPGMTYFLKGKANTAEVVILQGQESFRMDSFAQANCLIQLEDEKEIISKGELVQVLRFA